MGKSRDPAAGGMRWVPSGKNCTRSIGCRSANRGRRAEPVRIDPGTIELDVEVPSYPAELLVVVAADPHRVLHRRQRERLAFLG